LKYLTVYDLSIVSNSRSSIPSMNHMNPNLILDEDWDLYGSLNEELPILEAPEHLPTLASPYIETPATTTSPSTVTNDRDLALGDHTDELPELPDQPIVNSSSSPENERPISYSQDPGNSIALMPWSTNTSMTNSPPRDHTDGLPKSPYQATGHPSSISKNWESATYSQDFWHSTTLKPPSMDTSITELPQSAASFQYSLNTMTPMPFSTNTNLTAFTPGNDANHLKCKARAGEPGPWGCPNPNVIPTQRFNEASDSSWASSIPKPINDKTWSEEEKAKLCSLVETHGRSWKVISTQMDRSDNACLKKWQLILQTSSWAPAEDEKLIRLITTYPGSWYLISALHGKSEKACRGRWQQHLRAKRPDVHTFSVIQHQRQCYRWDHEEDEVLRKLVVDKGGDQWPWIAKRLSRTAEECSKRWEWITRL